MSSANKQQAESEEIELLRGGSVVSTFVGAFGRAVRETRLTALLGYLVALEPEPFLELFGFTGKASSVRLEHRYALGRSDIIVETTHGLGLIEAKVGASDPFEQSLKYQARWSVLLTQYMPSGNQRNRKRVKYLRWERLTDSLDRLSRSQKADARFLSRDLLKYLEVHRMIKQRRSVEVYAREINEPITLNLFLKAQMYGCRYEANSQLAEALYFAPHFGQTLAKTYAGIRVGISYIARIERIEVAESWEDFFTMVKSVRTKTWWNSHASELEPLRTAWNWKESRKWSFLFLGTPRLVFNPPVNKEKLQKGKGWLSKRVFSFDDFFQGWGT